MMISRSGNRVGSSLAYLRSVPRPLLVTIAFSAVWLLAPTVLVLASGRATYWLRNVDDDLLRVASNSVIVSLLSLAVVVPIAVLLAWHAQAGPLWLRSLICVGLMPLILGPGASVLNGKILLDDWLSTGILNEHSLVRLALLTVVWNLLYYTPPLTFLISLSLRTVSNERKDLLTVYAARDDEQFRLESAPRLALAVAPLTFLVLCFMMTDSSIANVLYKPSKGTRTDTLVYGLERTYARLQGTPESAISDIMPISIFASLWVLALGVLAALLARQFLREGAKQLPLPSQLFRRNRIRGVAAGLLSLSPILVYAAPLRKLCWPSWDMLGLVATASIRMVMISVLVCAAAWSVGCGVFWSRRVAAGVRDRWLGYAMVSCAIYAVPPVCLAFASFFWSSLIGGRLWLVSFICFAASMLAYQLPLALMFVAQSLRSVPPTEVDLQRLYSAAPAEAFKLSILSRFKLDAFVLLLLCFGIGVMEGPISSMYSSHFGSIHTFVESRVKDRGASLPEATTILAATTAVTLLLSVAAGSLLLRRADSSRGVRI